MCVGCGRVGSKCAFEGKHQRCTRSVFGRMRHVYSRCTHKHTPIQTSTTHSLPSIQTSTHTEHNIKSNTPLHTFFVTSSSVGAFSHAIDRRSSASNSLNCRSPHALTAAATASLSSCVHVASNAQGKRSADTFHVLSCWWVGWGGWLRDEWLCDEDVCNQNHVQNHARKPTHMP